MPLPLLPRGPPACFASLPGMLPLRSAPARRGLCSLRASISDEVNASLKSAMLAKDAGRLRALRGIRAAFLTAMKEDGADAVADERAVAELRRLAKMRRESIDMFRQGGRDDLREQEEEELAVIEKWLPVLADEAKTREWAEMAVEQTGAKGKKDFGKVMGKVMKEHKAEIDGALLKRVVTELL